MDEFALIRQNFLEIAPDPSRKNGKPGPNPEVQSVNCDHTFKGGVSRQRAHLLGQDYVFCKKRNKLLPATADDLVYVFSNRRLLDRVTAVEYAEDFMPWLEDDKEEEAADA